METNGLIRCIVVDDEHPAVRLLSGYIKSIPGLKLVLQTTNASEALAAIENGWADLVFLDIQMPQMTGIELISAMKNHKPKVIFTTAYTEYALKGYQYDVIDYLLKPITFERFLVGIAKARQRIGSISSPQCPGYLMIKTEYRLQKVDFASILYIESLGETS
jgi:two-component system LytT family response regulator